MTLKIDDTTITFKRIPLTFHKRDIENVFYLKNNKSLIETFKHKKYQRLQVSYGDTYTKHHASKVGDFLQQLKLNNDQNYIKFLNKYGDLKFCEFSISDNLVDKGIYCFKVGNEIKYVGRCTDNFKKRINQGYGKIHPKNCFIDGQATNCHINSLINLATEVEFGVHTMTDKSTDDIKRLEKTILATGTYQWNIQTR